MERSTFMKLWTIDMTGFSGIELHPVEPFGDLFVYTQTEKRAREIFENGVRTNWGGCSGTHVSIPRTCTVKQARELRRLVEQDVNERQKQLNSIRKALEGIDDVVNILESVKRILSE